MVKSRRKRRGVDVDVGAVRALRSLSDEEAFRFYSAVEEPTGDAAGSLSDFLKKIESVKLESLTFHLQRKDFQRWVETTLGDSKLAKRIGRIRSSCDESLRKKMRTTVENRIKELTETPLALQISGGLAVISPSATR